MDIREFLSGEETGFHIAYIDHPTLTGEEIQANIPADLPTIVVHGVGDHVYGLGSFATTLREHLEENDLNLIDGLVRKLLASLNPDIIGEDHPLYPDIHGEGVHSTLAYLMDRAAENLKSKHMVWIIDEFPFDESNDLWQFINTLPQLESPYRHSIIVLSYKPALPHAVKLDSPVEPPLPTLRGKEKKTVTYLSLLSLASYGYIRREVAYELIDSYKLEKGYIRLRDKGVVLETNGYVKIVDRRVWKQSIENASQDSIKDVISFINKRESPARLYTAAHLHYLMGQRREAINAILNYGQKMKQLRRPMEGQINTTPLLVKLWNDLTDADKELYIDIASVSGHVDDVVKRAIREILENGKPSAKTLMNIAWLSTHLDSRERSLLINTIRNAIENTDRVSETILAHALLATYHAENVFVVGPTQEAMLHIRVDHVDDIDLLVKMLTILSRTYLYFGKYSEALKYIIDAIKMARDIYPPYLDILYNNLVYALKKLHVENDIKLSPIARKSIEIGFLYGNIVPSSIALQNYVAIASEAGIPYRRLLKLIREMSTTLKLAPPEARLHILIAEAIAHISFGYIDEAKEAVEKMKDLVHTHAKWTTKGTYYILKYRISKQSMDLDLACHFLNMYIEKFGSGETVENMKKALRNMKNPSQVCRKDAFASYTTAIRLGKPHEGIQILKELLWEDISHGNLLSAAYDQLYIANLFSLSGNPYLANKHLFVSTILSLYLGMKESEELVKKIKFPINLQEIPYDNLLLTLLESHASYIISGLSEVATLEDFFASILHFIPIPAFSMWIRLKSKNNTIYREYSVSPDIFRGFYKDPFSISKIIKRYGISDQPSYIYVNLSQGDTSLIIYGQNSIVDGAFSEKHLAVLSMWAEKILDKAIALSKGSHILMDEETGLYSQWYIRHILEQEFQRMKRERKPLSVIMLGIEKNTYLSNMWQKDIMKAVGSIVRSTIRSVDSAGRIDNNIIIILPGTDTHEAALVARRILQRGAENLKKLGISLYAGIDGTSYPPRYKKIDSLISGAALAMGQAIASGKDICMYQEMQKKRDRGVL